jgi:hypothetical protein
MEYDLMKAAEQPYIMKAAVTMNKQPMIILSK